MALRQSFSTQLVENHEEYLFFVPYHFVVAHYGHITVAQTYAVERKVLSDDLMLGLPGQRSIGPYLARNAIPYPYETVTEDEPEWSSEDHELDDKNNESNKDNNQSDNDIMETVVNTLKKLWKTCYI